MARGSDRKACFFLASQFEFNRYFLFQNFVLRHLKMPPLYNPCTFSKRMRVIVSLPLYIATWCTALNHQPPCTYMVHTHTHTRFLCLELIVVSNDRRHYNPPSAFSYRIPLRAAPTPPFLSRVQRRFYDECREDPGKAWGLQGLGPSATAGGMLRQNMETAMDLFLDGLADQVGDSCSQGRRPT